MGCSQKVDSGKGRWRKFREPKSEGNLPVLGPGAYVKCQLGKRQFEMDFLGFNPTFFHANAIGTRLDTQHYPKGLVIASLAQQGQLYSPGIAKSSVVTGSGSVRMCG